MAQKGFCDIKNSGKITIIHKPFLYLHGKQRVKAQKCYNMLRKIRISLATVFWLLITWLLVDFTGTAHVYLGWMARVQLMPALLSLNVGVLVFLLALTVLWGRIYCSVICPLGVMQDIIAWFRKKRFKYRFTPARTVLRWSLVLFTGAALVLNLGWLAGLVLPYSTYGRITGAITAPLYKLGNNLLAQVAEHYDSYAVYEVDVWVKSITALVIAILVWGIIAVLAWRGGRTWCNTICPVGTLLGALSRHAIFRPTINLSRCNGCGLCERECKAGCIDSKNHAIDLSRCVMCGDCMEVCSKKAMTLASCTSCSPAEAETEQKTAARRSRGGRGRSRGEEKEKQEKNTTKPSKAAAPATPVTAEAAEAPKRKPRRRKPKAAAEGEGSVENPSRRAALTTTAMLAGAVVLRAQKKVEPKTTDGGFAPITPKTPMKREHRITPPGSISLRNLQSHCTACQLCIDACPNDVLRPSTSLATFLQPEVSFEKGYCRPECNRCSQVCPTGAIKPITIEERTATQVGHAVWNKELCLPAKEGKPCGNCARRCPNGAIQLIPASDKYHKNEHGRWIGPDGKQMDGRLVPMIPVVNVEKCTGCGACENLCPVSPQSAIHVEGHDVHREI